MYADNFLDKKLKVRKEQNAFRYLKTNDRQIDFCSNDYLGIIYNNLLNESDNQFAQGSGGSRLLAGNYALTEETETLIASFHQAQTALIFNSGYDANIGLISCIPQRGDTILYDFLCHASLRDGIRLSLANSFSFVHNDVVELEQKLKKATGTIFVVTESVFSMDGDICPLKEILILCKKYNAHLILDEAHATGIVGHSGEGLAQLYQLQAEIFARIHTFGKACGCHGAVILGSQRLKDYLINFSRSFIYSTALPPHAIQMIKKSYQLFPTLQKERQQINRLIEGFQKATLSFIKLNSCTPIQAVIIPENKNVKLIAARLQQNNFDIRPVLYPTVPKGLERLRIILHAFNTEEQLLKLIEVLNE